MLASRSQEDAARLHGPKHPLTIVENAPSNRRNSRRISLNAVQALGTAFRRGTIHHTGQGIADLVGTGSPHSIIYTSRAIKAYRQKRALHHKHFKRKKEHESSEKFEVLQRPIERFRKIVRLVIILRHAFKNIVFYASQKGRHEQITSETTLSLRANTAKGTYEDLMFDPEMFKSQFKDSFPSWAKHVADKPPHKRTNEEIKLLVRLMKQLKGFRRYSPEVQVSFCKVLKYDQYARRRVIIRKGHIAQRLYFIFSGSVCVTDDEDEHSAFVNSEDEKVCLKRGDYFGELAFLKNIRRAATIVCLEITEFLSVSKEDFFGTGIDRCFASDVEKRYNFLSNHPLFITWTRNALRLLAEVSRVHEFHSDDVISKNSIESNWIYFISKGQCDVLRLVDLKKCPAYQKYMNRICASSTSTGVNHSCRRTSTQFDYSTLITYPIAEEDEDDDNDTCQRSNNDVVSCRSAMNLSVHRQQMHGPPSASNSRSKSAQVRSRSMPHNFYFPPSACTNSQGNKDAGIDVGVGVYMVLDRLTPGKFFGTWSIINQEDIKDRKRAVPAEERRFILVSGGCEVIKMPKKEFYRGCDDETMTSLRILTSNYPSDNMLCHAYLKQSEWRCYREELVEDLVERNQASREASTGLRRATVPQAPTIPPLCSFNPKQSLSANFEYFRGSGWMAVSTVSPLVKGN